MAPLGLGGGFYGLGPTINAGEAVHVNDEDGNYMVVPTGAGNGLQVLDGFQSTFRGSFTFSTYFYGGNVPKIYNDIFAYLFSTQGPSDQHVIQLYTSPSSVVTQVNFKIEANNDEVIFRGNISGLNNNATGWHHILVTATKNSSANTTGKIFVDGVDITSSSLEQGDLSDTNHGAYDEHGSAPKIIIGGRHDLDGNNRAWLLKHAALWSVALDADNIAEIYGAGINTPLDLTSASGDYDQQGNLVGYWKLIDGAGTTAVDTTGNNNGTLTGNATLI